MSEIHRRSFIASVGLSLVCGPRSVVQAREIVVLASNGTKVLAGGRSHRLADVTFLVTTDFSDRGGLEIGPGADIDVLRIRVARGVRRIDRLISVGSGARIGLIDVAAEQQIGAVEGQLDGLLQIRANDVRIEAMEFHGIDRCVTLYRANGVEIGSLQCESYFKAIRIMQSDDVKLDHILARSASPNAQQQVGFSAITISDSHGLQFRNVHIEDAAVHGVYIGGGGEGDRGSRDIRFGKVKTLRSGKCGFKCKAPVTPTNGVSIEHLEVIDAAFGTKPGRNEDALRLENATNVYIGRLDAHRARNRVSCYAGIYLDGVREFSLDGGHVKSPAGPMVMIEDRRGRSNTDIRISNLHGTNLRTHGYRIAYSNGQQLSRLRVEGGRLDGIGGDVVRVEGNPSVDSDCIVDAAVSGAQGVALSSDPGSATPAVRTIGITGSLGNIRK